MQNWRKIGQVFFVNNNNPFLLTHGANPVAVHLNNDDFRIFYSGRNIDNKSSVGFVDLNIENLKIINYPKKPIITFGAEGTYYSHGISLGNIYEVNGNKFLLFMGWQYPENAHWRGVIGKLQLIRNDVFFVDTTTPFLSIDAEDSISLSYSFVLFHERIYKMWYGSTITWDAGNQEMIHVIKYATSTDGVNWLKHGIAIPYDVNVAQAFSKPSVVIDKNGYHMWYSYRDGKGTSYRIGYAFSIDGTTWERKQKESGIDISTNGWDSEMICYPFVFDHKGKRYMLYNGNGYGKTGFGLAILEQD